MLWRLRVPSVPREAGGLFAALAVGGAALEEWNRIGRPLLVNAIRCAGADAETAEDVAQEILIRAVRMDRGGRCPRNECAWMAVVARNLLAVEGRRLRREREAAVSLSRMSCRKEEEAPDRIRPLARLLLRLPPPYREALILRLIAQLPYEVVLFLLQQSQGVEREAARKILRRGRRMLARLLRRRRGRVLHIRGQSVPREVPPTVKRVSGAARKHRA